MGKPREYDKGRTAEDADIENQKTTVYEGGMVEGGGKGKDGTSYDVAQNGVDGGGDGTSAFDVFRTERNVYGCGLGHNGGRGERSVETTTTQGN